LATFALAGCAQQGDAPRTLEPVEPGEIPRLDGMDAGANLPPLTASPEELLADVESEPEIEPEDFEQQGFCPDDVYARYLLAQYRIERPVTPKPKIKEARARRGRKGSRIRLDGEDVDALAWAFGRLNGKVSPYFGALPVVVNDRVNFWIQYFKTSGRKQYMSWLVRGESIKRSVQPTLQGVGIPLEFFYLAMVESGFSNSAYSRARATGTWQFMSGTAQIYGLKINHWVDERRDPIKSTIAAANYLKDLYAELGDWYLAMAAYNAGPGKIQRAIRKTGTRDFWTIAETHNIARETAQYVPKVLAAVMLAAEAKAHGFDVKPNPADEIPETEVALQRPVRLDEVAAKLDLPLSSLQAWNPELVRGVTPPLSKNTPSYALRLPAAHAARFPQIEPELTELEITDVQMHTIRRGETLGRIAKLYKVTVRQIMAYNPDLRANRLKLGRQVAIPIPGIVSAKGKAARADGDKSKASL
jgi:membrane-bound lytic murein transglycosylase D